MDRELDGDAREWPAPRQNRAAAEAMDGGCLLRRWTGSRWHEATEAERRTWRIAEPRHDGGRVPTAREVQLFLALHRDYYAVDLSAQTRGLTLINAETVQVR